jgi:hypothetical protein
VRKPKKERLTIVSTQDGRLAKKGFLFRIGKRVKFVSTISPGGGRAIDSILKRKINKTCYVSPGSP